MVDWLRKNPADAKGYLDSCLAEGHEAFQLGLRYAVEAFGGMTALSRKTSLNREALYRALSRRGNPCLENVEKVLGALGMRLSVTVRQSKATRRPASKGR
jgi:probable addiction module antidote protein